eukprot:5326590-Alexandrium_andersonii.AAC.1
MAAAIESQPHRLRLGRAGCLRYCGLAFRFAVYERPAMQRLRAGTTAVAEQLLRSTSGLRLCQRRLAHRGP